LLSPILTSKPVLAVAGVKESSPVIRYYRVQGKAINITKALDSVFYVAFRVVGSSRVFQKKISGKKIGKII
jgi:hypothetical protein